VVAMDQVAAGVKQVYGALHTHTMVEPIPQALLQLETMVVEQVAASVEVVAVVEQVAASKLPVCHFS